MRHRIVRILRPNSSSRLARIAVIAAITYVAFLWPRPAMAQPTDVEQCRNVGRDVVVAAGERLDCDLSIVGGDLRLETGAIVAGDVGIVSGHGDIAGTVEGDVAVLWGDAELSGTVEGDLFVSGDLQLLDGSRVVGDVSVLGGIDKEQGAVVEGAESTLRGLGASGRRPARTAARWIMPLVFAFVTIALAGLFAALAVGVIPDAVAMTRGAAESTKGVLLSTFIGSTALFALPIFLIVTLITVIGPLIVLAAYGVGVALGSVGAGEILGRRLAPRSGRPLRAAIGAGVIAAILAVPLYFGTELGFGRVLCGTALLAWIAISWALGASIRAFANRRTGATQHAVAVPEPSVVQLSDLPGMTPIYAALLQSEGISSIEDVGRSSVEKIEAALDRPGVRPVERSSIQAWIDAARGPSA